MAIEQEHRPVVVITGASAGVGRATARAFAKRKARIGLLARGKDGLQATRREVEELGGEAIALSVDVADAAAIEAAAMTLEQQLGPIDVWLNNAMTSVFSPVKEMGPEEYHRVTDVTYLGVVDGTLAALRRMLPRGHGVIVQVARAPVCVILTGHNRHRRVDRRGNIHDPRHRAASKRRRKCRDPNLFCVGLHDRIEPGLPAAGNGLGLARSPQRSVKLISSSGVLRTSGNGQ